MRIILIPLFLAFSLSVVRGQYIRYHNLINEANEQRYRKNYEASLQLFQTGFDLVDYVHAMNYVKAATAATKLKRYDLVAEYLSKAILAGYPSRVFDGKAFKSFRKSDHYELLQAKLSEFDSKTEAGINYDGEESRQTTKAPKNTRWYK